MQLRSQGPDCLCIFGLLCQILVLVRITLAIVQLKDGFFSRLGPFNKPPSFGAHRDSQVATFRIETERRRFAATFWILQVSGETQTLCTNRCRQTTDFNK